MEQELFTILESFGFPVYRQGSMSKDATYPETFITYWNNDTPETMYYDNAEHCTVWDYNVFVYSSIYAHTYTLPLEILRKLKEAGWIVPSKGFDAVSDAETHTGRGLEVYFMQTEPPISQNAGL